MKPSPDEFANLSRAQLSALLSLAGGDLSEEAGVRVIGRANEARAAVDHGGVGDGEPGAMLREVEDPRTSLSRLVTIKRSGKALLTVAGDAATHDALMLLYHGAIAAAFARHGALISSRPLGLRLGLYDAWATVLNHAPLRTVFREAVDRMLGAAPTE